MSGNVWRRVVVFGVAIGVLSGGVALATSGGPHHPAVRVRAIDKGIRHRLIVGDTVRVPRRWKNPQAIQWLRCNARGSRCRAIRGAHHRTYILRRKDLGHRLRVEAVIQGNTVALSAATGQVGRPLPVNQSLPTISDNGTLCGSTCSPLDGDTLTGTDGTWKWAVVYTHQWQDCTTASPPVCTSIPGATGLTYTLQDSDVGSTIQLVITAYNYNAAGGTNP